MPFSPPPETLDYWQDAGFTAATAADIPKLEARLGGKAPLSYVEFMQTYGDVEFDDEINSRFDYVYEHSGRTEIRSQAISFIKSPAKSLQYYDGIQKAAKRNISVYLLPFGMDYGQGELFIEFGQPTERIFYWDFDAHDWGTDETQLGFVAGNMYHFINNLEPFVG